MGITAPMAPVMTDFSPSANVVTVDVAFDRAGRASR
jgi:hypothetical protein